MRVKIIPEADLQLLSKAQQHAYLLRVWYKINQEECYNIPCWLYYLAMAYFTGDTNEIEGTPTMSSYRDVLLNQLLP
ncbi:hypothetical protein [Spirosoma spitsbergense]|uniref:hypothetical protein n=1 Tax=Spirosoma spitsbergense TaxID=431554 RepID=UPI000373D8E6|nr:hypothetical protein [Spirosoma spitsbergense]